MSNKKLSAAALSLESNLEELQRREDLEKLRPFVIEHYCFLPNKDASTSQ